MNTKIISIIILAFYFVANIYGQDTYQTFTAAGFKVKCGCKLYENTVFISMAKQQGMNNILAAYICAENEDNPDIGVIHNINIYDESKNYIDIQPSSHANFEKKYLEEYANNLKNSGIAYSYTTYQGVSAIEYTFDQLGLPTRAIIFLKNKKSYLIQVGTRKNLSTKFIFLKSSFAVLTMPSRSPNVQKVESNKVYKTNKIVSLRATPNSRSIEFKLIGMYEKVRVIEFKDDWVKIEYSNESGWVEKSAISIQ